MESVLMNSQQVVVEDHHLRHRAFYDSCSSSSSTSVGEEDEDEDEDDLLDSSSSSSPLQDMSSLLLQLPLKRGLSKHYNGKSESFTSLSNVKSLEDLAKQENPINKRLKLGNPSNNNQGSHFSSLTNGGRGTRRRRTSIASLEK